MEQCVYFKEISDTEVSYVIKKGFFEEIEMSVEESVTTGYLIYFFSMHLSEIGFLNESYLENPEKIAMIVMESEDALCFYVHIAEDLSNAEIMNNFNRFLSNHKNIAYENITEQAEEVINDIEKSGCMEDENGIQVVTDYDCQYEKGPLPFGDMFKKQPKEKEPLPISKEKKVDEIWFFSFSSLEAIKKCYTARLSELENTVYRDQHGAYILGIRFIGTEFDAYLTKGYLMEFGKLQKYKYYEGEALIKENALNVLQKYI